MNPSEHITPAGFAMPLEANIRYLPMAFRLAIEWLDAQGDNRTRARLAATIEHYLHATATEDLTTRDLDFYTESAVAICAKRFHNFEADA